MSIFLNNYESWFLDYHEGSLNDKQKELVLRFLKENPKLNEEFNAFDNNVVLNENFVSFNNKENLKAPAAKNFDELLIAYIEDELSLEEKKKTDELISSNKKIAAELSLFKKTLLAPDLSIVFPKKKNLKKDNKGVIRLMFYTSAAVAACVLFFTLNITGLFNGNGNIKPTANLSSDSLKSKDTPFENPIKEQVQIAKEMKKEKGKSLMIAEKTKEKTKKSVKIFDSNILMDEEQIKQPLLSEEESILAKHDIANPDSIHEIPIPVLSEELYADNNPAALPKTTLIKVEAADKFLTPKELFIQHLKNITSSNTELVTQNSSKLSFWEIASVGTSSISKVTGKKLKISRNTNEEGEISSFAIISDRFGFSRSTSK